MKSKEQKKKDKEIRKKTHSEKYICNHSLILGEDRVYALLAGKVGISCGFYSLKSKKWGETNAKIKLKGGQKLQERNRRKEIIRGLENLTFPILTNL